MHCTRCGYDNKDDAKYCSECGLLIQADVANKAGVQNDIKFRSHIKVYWVAWLSFVALCLVIRFVFVTGDSKSIMGLLCILLPWLAIICLWIYLGLRIAEYMGTHHPQRWDLLSGRSFLDGSPFNFIISWRASWFILFSRDDLGDPNIRLLRKEYWQMVFLMLTMFFSSLVLSGFLME